VKKIQERPAHLLPVPTSFCPGCTHGTATRIMMEALEELNTVGDTILVLPVGCGALIREFTDLDQVLAAHGRAPALATGIKRCLPDKTVLTYQGDGDLAAIGTSEIIHAANRGEHFTTIFVNNAIYGMTGGQMAPTTLEGQISTTTRTGRDPKETGYPIRMCEMLATLEAPVYIVRCALNTPGNIRKAKKAVKKALEIQRGGGGFAFVELLSTCPTNWKLNPVDSLKFIETHMIPYFPLGVFKDKGVDML